MSKRTDGMNFLYLVASGNDDGIYKIGISVDPVQRLEQIKRDYSVPNAFILETMDVGSRDEVFAVESALHDKYDRFQSNAYPGREWFKLSKSQIAEIKTMYQQESNAFAQATAFFGLVEECARLQPKATEMEAERQVKIRYNRVNGKRYNTKPVGYLKRFNELQKTIKESLLGQRFETRVYPHSAVDLLKSSAKEIKDAAKKRVSHFWYTCALGGLAGGLILTGGDTAAGVLSGITGFVSGGLTSVNRPESEEEEAKQQFTTVIERVYPDFTTQKLLAVIDNDEHQSFLVKALHESDEQTQLRNQPATRPRVSVPDLQKAKNLFLERNLFPKTAAALTAGMVVIGAFNVEAERKERNQAFISTTPIVQIWNA